MAESIGPVEIAKNTSVNTDAKAKGTRKKSLPERFITGILNFLGRVLPDPILKVCFAFDRRVDGALSFFIKHYGKSRFMIAMSKKAQILGLEKLWLKSPKAFVYFFLYYLVRDTFLYIILPITIARWSSGP
jgi:hypothetical protein